MVEKYMKMANALQKDAEGLMKKAEKLNVDEKKLKQLEKALQHENDFKIFGITVSLILLATFIGINIWLI